MSDSYEKRKQNNLSQEGRKVLDEGGYYEVHLFLDWTIPPESETDHHLTLDFVANKDIEDEFFPSVDFESDERIEKREDKIAGHLNACLGELLERGLILDVYGNKHIGSVSDLEDHLEEFRIVN